MDNIQIELNRLSRELIDLGAKMEYLGGFNESITRKGKHLVVTGALMQEWAELMDVTKYDDPA